MVNSITIRFASGLYADIVANGDVLFGSEPVGICENSIVSEFQQIVTDLNEEVDEDEGDNIGNTEEDADELEDYDDTGIGI